MRRLLLVLMALFLICGCGMAEKYLADAIALEMAQSIQEMQDVHSAALADAPNRAIWTDSRTDAKCSLTVYESATRAEEEAVARGTPSTSVRPLGSCLLAVDSDLSAAVIDEYVLVLENILGMEAEEAPDYILNVNTKKFHYPDCSSVKEMKESNKQEYRGERDLIVAQGYKACKRCNP